MKISNTPKTKITKIGVLNFFRRYSPSLNTPKKCHQINNELSEAVLLRTEAIVNDVVASDVRYHKDCKTDFFLNIKDENDEEKPQDIQFFQVIKTVTTDKSRIWNSTELYNTYITNNDDVLLDRRTFIRKLVSTFNGELVSFHARGYAKLLCFKDHARGILKMAKDNDDDDNDDNDDDGGENIQT